MTAHPHGDRPDAPVLALHGSDRSGIPATWHVSALGDDGAAPGTYLVEHAEGDIHSPALWMQARRDAQTVGEDEVLGLVREVLFHEDS